MNSSSFKFRFIDARWMKHPFINVLKVKPTMRRKMSLLLKVLKGKYLKKNVLKRKCLKSQNDIKKEIFHWEPHGEYNIYPYCICMIHNLQYNSHSLAYLLHNPRTSIFFSKFD